MNAGEKIYLLTLTFICILFVDITSQTLSNPAESAADKETLIQLSIVQIHREVFDSVFANSAVLCEQYPDDPIGYFIAINAYQTMMRDYRVRRFEAEFDSLINLTTKIARESLKSQSTAENYFIFGATEGTRCIHWFRRGEWLKAIGAARLSIKALRFAMKLKPSFVDPLLGLALYEYAQSKVLGLFANKRKNAIMKLKRVQQEGLFTSISAMYALQMIYFETDKFIEALKLNDQLYEKFSQNPVCLYNRALLLEEMNRFSDAIIIWKKLISRIEMFVQPSNGYLAECHYHLAKIYLHLGEHSKASDELELAGRYASRYQPEQEMDGPYTTFKDTKKAIKQVMKNLAVK